jgi:hypothetical protein
VDASRSLLDSYDATWTQLEARCAGLDDAEYLWEPAPGGWTVRSTPSGPQADWADPDPTPAPVTTIAWRMWHIAVDALDSYSRAAFETSGSELTGRSWVRSASEAATLLARSVVTFRAGMAALDDEGLARPLGPSWDGYADQTHLDLFLHALRELTHHGAEIGLLRDLYAARGPDTAPGAGPRA